MHELSIAKNAIEVILDAIAQDAGRVTIVRLRIGSLAAVVPESLQFAWDVACRETRLDGSLLEIEKAPVRIWCDTCAAEREVPEDFSIRCPSCDEIASKVVSGRELEVLSVEMVDHDEAKTH